MNQKAVDRSAAIGKDSVAGRNLKGCEGDGAAANDALEAVAQQLAHHPDVRVARDKHASTAERLAAMGWNPRESV